MISKDTQIKELSEIIDSHHIACDIVKECYSKCAECAAEAIYEIGYRKKGGKNEKTNT